MEWEEGVGCLYNPTDTSNPFFGCRQLVLGAQSFSFSAALSLWALQLCFLWQGGARPHGEARGTKETSNSWKAPTVARVKTLINCEYEFRAACLC